MTETAIEPTSVRRFDLGRILAVFLHPRDRFVEVAGIPRAVWQMPMTVLSVTLLLSMLTSGYFKARAALQGTAPLPPDFQYWTPAMQQNYSQAQQAMQGPVFVYIIPAVGALTTLWLGWLILGGLIHLASTLLGGRGSMAGALNLAALAALPFALRDLLRIGFTLLAGHAIASPGLSAFASGAFAAQVLARLDLFLVWQIILLIIGLRVMDELPAKKAVAAVIVVMLLLLAAQAGMATLGSGLGGMAVQRPFF